jgi:HK97 family phage major capsid protein
MLQEQVPIRADSRWSAQLVQSLAWKEFKLSGRDTRVELKAAGDPIAGFLTVSTPPVVAPHAYGPAGVLDFINRVTVDSASIVYSTATYPLTNNAAFIAEGASKPENQPRWTNATARLEEVAAWCKVTRQALDDVVGLSRTIDVDLTAALEERTADRVINGSGTTPDILGILNTPGVQTVAFAGGATTLDMIFKGISAITASGYGQPNGIVMNPADALAMVSAKATTGNVFMLAPQLPPVASDAHLAAGTALIGDWRFATLYQRSPVALEVGYVNDDIIKNKITIAAYHRVALVISRPQAIAKVALA